MCICACNTFCLFVHLWTVDAIANNAAVNTGTHLSFGDLASGSFGFIPRSDIVGSYCKSMFNILRICHTVFHSSWTFYILHSHLECTRVCPHYFTSSPTIVISFLPFFGSSHPRGCKLVSHCSFDLHIPND